MAKYIAIEKNGELGACLPESLSHWERNGWTAVDDESNGESREESQVDDGDDSGDQYELDLDDDKE